MLVLLVGHLLIGWIPSYYLVGLDTLLHGWILLHAGWIGVGGILTHLGMA